MRHSRRWRYAGEYVLVRALLGAMDTLPDGVACALGQRLGRCCYYLDRPRRRVAIDNILRAGIAPDPGAAAVIARRSFEHFGRSLVEALTLERRFDPACPADNLVEDIHPDTRALFDDPERGLILVSGHVGNWEAAARIVATRKPVAAIASRIKNPRIDRLIHERRPTDQLTLIPKRSTDLGRLLKVIKERQILAMLVDQYGRDRGALVDFFGVPARTHASPAMLHLITRAPVCFGACLREPDGRLRITAPAPLTHPPSGNREADVHAILSHLNRHLEDVIRAYPEQYLWAHRRWRD